MCRPVVHNTILSGISVHYFSVHFSSRLCQEANAGALRGRSTERERDVLLLYTSKGYRSIYDYHMSTPLVLREALSHIQLEMPKTH